MQDGDAYGYLSYAYLLEYDAPSPSSVCQYSVSYADGSGFTATLYDDVVGVEGTTLSVSAPVLGAITSKAPGELQPKQVDGIMGIAYGGPGQGSVSSAGEYTPFEAWVRAGQIANLFSLCMHSEGGTVVLGGAGAEYNNGAVQYAPLVSESYYVVEMMDLQVCASDGSGGYTTPCASLGLAASVYNEGQAIVDSGTTGIVLPDLAYSGLQAKIQELGLPYFDDMFGDYCTALAADQLSGYPYLNFVLTGETGEVNLYLSPLDYLGDCAAGGYFGSAISGSHAQDGTILGDSFMKAFNVVFDRVNSRVGFAPSACPTS